MKELRTASSSCLASGGNAFHGNELIWTPCVSYSHPWGQVYQHRQSSRTFDYTDL